MALLITFKSAMFDISAEPPNPTNPIAGESLLRWLRAELQKDGFEVTEPDHEDWGWYVEASADAGSYMIGASADADDAGPAVEWTVQVHKRRSFTDKLLGRNKPSRDDRLFGVVERAIRAGAAATDIAVDGSA